MDILETIIKDTMPMLRFSVWIEHALFTSSSSSSSSSGDREFLRLDGLRHQVSKRRNLVTSRRGQITLDAILADPVLLSWVQSVLRLPNEVIDIFLSYRWGPDSPLSELIYDIIKTRYTLSADYRAVTIFRDKKVLKMGEDFVIEMCNKLIRSVLVVILLTPAAIERMKTHDVNKPDYTLLEWILSIVCYDLVEVLKNK